MTSHQEITDQILNAWDDAVDEAVEEEEAEPETEVEVAADGEEAAVEETGETEEEVEEAADDEPAEGEEEEAEEAEADAETEEQPEVEALTDDPLALAYLAKYGGNVAQAIVAAANLEKVLGKQGAEKHALARRVSELEGELAQANAFASARPFLNNEQSDWVEEAATSENPAAYVRQALGEGEFVLARAVCDEWAKESPYEAVRASQVVDHVEAQARQAYAAQNQQAGLPAEILMDVLVQNFPDMPSYEQQMVSTLGTLGDDHPIVIDSRSSDPQIAARGIVGLYEIARAASVSVNGAREQVKRKQREAGDGARAAAQVSSAQASPTSGETPRRQTHLMPGLTLEQLDEAFEHAQQ